MEITYTMIGGDGAHYGPVSLQQIKTWITEGRVTAETKVLRSDTKSWLPAAQYTELGVAPVAPLPTAIAQASAPTAFATASTVLLERRVKVSANWFYWIAALSLVNTFIARSGNGIQFVVGLAVTQLADAFGSTTDAGPQVALVFNIFAAGIFGLLGFFAGQRHVWAFIVGMVFFALDGVLCLLGKSYFMLGFHVFVLFLVFKGLQANIHLNKQNR